MVEEKKPVNAPDMIKAYYEIEGKEAIYYKVYKPSSEMDSKEMWLLIQGLESECKLQGIETLEERKFKEMMESYER